MARQKRTRFFKIRVTDDEAKILKEKAKEKGLTMSDYIRMQSCKPSRRPHYDALVYRYKTMSARLKEMAGRESVDKSEFNQTMQELGQLLSVTEAVLCRDEALRMRIPRDTPEERAEKQRLKAQRVPKKRGRKPNEKQLTVKDMLQIKARLMSLLTSGYV